MTTTNIAPGAWTALDERTQEDLQAWFNCNKPDAEDLARLATLHANGQFRAWDCPACGDRVYEGSPDDWGHFQGACQVNYTSYPGDTDKYSAAYLQKLCDYC